MSDAPKSAVELAMEKLASEDAKAGAESRELTPTQKETIAQVRQEYTARSAECRILHDSSAATAMDPEARNELEANYRRDLARLAHDRDRKIERILAITE